MQCPLLRTGHAHYCHAADERTLILDRPERLSQSLCLSADYGRCSLIHTADPDSDKCPQLEETDVQFCGAVPVVKLVPSSDRPTSSCAHGGYKYCRSYLASAPDRSPVQPSPELFYAPNHMWLDPCGEGPCHIGVDSFLARLAKSVSDVTFVASEGTQRPTVLLTVSGIEWPLVFPNCVAIQSVNSHLRAHPNCLTSDPYGSGWLFQGWEISGKSRDGLVRGTTAEEWLQEERARLSASSRMMSNDSISRKVDLARLFQQFFSKTDWTAER